MHIEKTNNDIIIHYNEDDLQNVIDKFTSYSNSRSKDIYNDVAYNAWGLCLYKTIINNRQISLNAIKDVLFKIAKDEEFIPECSWSWSEILNNTKYKDPVPSFPITYDLIHICLPKHIIKLLL